MKFVYKNISWFLLAIIGVLIWLYLGQCNKANNQVDLISAISDKLTLTRDSLGRQTAKISVISVYNKKSFTAIKSKDSTIQALQALVSDTKGLLSATVLSNSTANVVRSVTTISRVDTVWRAEVMEIYPVYWTMFKNEWENFNVTANRDTFIIDYTLYNKFEITQAREKREKGLFKRKVPVITIKNLNPHTETLALRSFAIKPQPRRISIGVGVYYGVTIPDGKLSALAGGGIQFNIFGR